MRNRRAFILSCAAASALATVLTQDRLQAVTVTNQTTNQVIFESNGFESDAVGTAPNVTGAGTWVTYYTDRVIAGGTPGPFAGNNYATTTRDNSGAGGPEAHFSANQTTAGDHIHMEFPLWIPSAGDEALILHNSSTYYRGLGRITGGQYMNYDGFGYIPTGVSYTPNTWQTWTIDYTVGDANYTVGIMGGNSASAPALDGIANSGAGGPIDGLYFGHNGNDTFFIDGAFTGPPQEPQWVSATSGNYNSTGNWIGGVPNAPGAPASFLGAAAGPVTVFTDTPVTVGSLKFDNTNTYQITGNGSLTVEVSTGAGSVNVIHGSHKINLPLFFASNTDVTVAAGATLTIADPATIRANKTVTKSGNVVISAPLTLEAGAVLVNASGAMSVFGAPSLTGGSKIDLKNNAMTVDYRGQSSPASTIAAQLASAYAAGAWTGNGITSSSTIAGRTGVGWKDDAASQSILVKYAYYGDANLDGTVNSADFAALAAHFNLSSTLGS